MSGLSSPKTSRIMLVAGLIVVWLMVLVAGWYFISKSPQVPERYAALGGDFTLTSSQGPVSLSDFRGKVMVVFFGYTHCPDICSAALNNVAVSFAQLDVDELAQSHALFISVDPERDTPQVATEYAAYFHTQITGLSGDLKQISAVAKQFGVYFAKQVDEESESPDDYYVGHSRSLFVINPDGRVVDMIKHDTDPALITQRIRTWLP